MDKSKFESIFQDAVVYDVRDDAFIIPYFVKWFREHPAKTKCDESFMYGAFEHYIKKVNANIKLFEEEIAKTKKILSEPCSGYLKHKLMDWYDYLTDTLKHDMEKYEQTKEELLIYFHYLA